MVSSSEPVEVALMELLMAGEDVELTVRFRVAGWVGDRVPEIEAEFAQFLRCLTDQL